MSGEDSHALGMTERPTIVWRRLDRPGREVALVRRIRSGWRLFGTVELQRDAPQACLSHVTTCDRHWQTRDCEITGFVENVAIAVHVGRDSAGRWSLGGVSIPETTGCDDIDLAFSPLTNLLPIRRLALAVGSSARVRAAWLRFPELTLEVLQQTYTRVDRDRYLYETADGAFRRELTVNDTGLVLEYPGLWTADFDAGSGELLPA